MKYIVAHRGLSSKAPENTLESFDLAILSGVTHIEFDVHLSKDNEVVVVHDDTVDRTSNGAGKVNSMTLEELQQLDFGSWFSKEFSHSKIPSLRNILMRYKSVNLVIEIKGKDKFLVEKVFKIIHSNQYWKEKIYKSKEDEPGIIFCSFHTDQLMRLREISNDIFIGYLVKEINQDILNFASSLSLDGIFSYYKSLNKENMTLLDNYYVSCYGFKKPNEVGELLNMGVDAVTVDWPDKL